MSQYTAIPDIIRKLKEIPELEDAVIVEDFTSPSVSRPVLQPIVSVGVKEMVMEPVTRYKHKLNCITRLSLLFPCGLGDSSISETVYKISAAFVGRVYHYFLVDSVTVKNTEFNSQMYGVMAELELHMTCTENAVDPSDVNSIETYSLGGFPFDRFPDRVVESRSKSKDLNMSACPREFILEGSSSGNVTGALWNNLHRLMASDAAIDFNFPRASETAKVKPESIHTEGDVCGYGFTYKLVFTEVL